MVGRTVQKLAFATIIFTLGMQLPMQAESRPNHEGTGKAIETGEFHGKVHKTVGRASIYQAKDGKLVLRLTHFSTSNGPQLHVILIAANDAEDDANFLKSNTDRVDLGDLKGNQGDQNYEIPSGTDLSKYRTVSVFCERFNANFGAAPLQKL